MYVMESFHDYRMANNRSIIEQAHEIKCITKELDHLKIFLILLSKLAFRCGCSKELLNDRFGSWLLDFVLFDS
jgi:hypothetical protein